MRRMLQVVDWRFLLTAAFLALVVQMGFNSWEHAKHHTQLVEQIKAERVEAVKDRAAAQRERERLVAGLKRLLVYLESAGVEIPSNVSRPITVDPGSSTRVTVRPQTVNPTPPTSSSSPTPSGPPSSPPNNDGGVPEVPLPEPVGQATDTAKRIIEDVTGIVAE